MDVQRVQLKIYKKNKKRKFPSAEMKTQKFPNENKKSKKYFCTRIWEKKIQRFIIEGIHVDFYENSNSLFDLALVYMSFRMQKFLDVFLMN